MNRYIEVDKAVEALYRYICPTKKTIEEDIRAIPTTDIVRCSECKYKPICSHSVQHTTHELTSVTIGYKSVDYCSYGERESDE